MYRRAIMDISKKYEGETWEWANIEKTDVNFTSLEQGIMDVYMKWINTMLVNSALDNCPFTKLDKYEDKNLILYFQSNIKSYLTLLKAVGFYPKEYFDKECPEANYIFERSLTCYELYRIIYNLDLLEKRYQILFFGRADEESIKTEKYKKYFKNKIAYMKKLYDTPEMFKYR